MTQDEKLRYPVGKENEQEAYQLEFNEELKTSSDE